MYVHYKYCKVDLNPFLSVKRVVGTRFFYRSTLKKGFVNIIFKLLKGSDNDRQLTLPASASTISNFFIRKRVICFY